MTAPDEPGRDSGPRPNRLRRGRRPLLVLGGLVAGLGIAGAATGITLAAAGSEGHGPGGTGPGHHRHGPPVAGQDGGRPGPGADRLVPPDQD